jgi:hypothetical protein
MGFYRILQETVNVFNDGGRFPQETMDQFGKAVPGVFHVIGVKLDFYTVRSPKQLHNLPPLHCRMLTATLKSSAAQLTQKIIT